MNQNKNHPKKFCMILAYPTRVILGGGTHETQISRCFIAWDFPRLAIQRKRLRGGVVGLSLVGRCADGDDEEQNWHK